MELYTREFGGKGLPVIILHGLFASSKNWISTARYLAGFSRPYALDLRNHGDSSHSAAHTLADLIADLREWLEAGGIEKAVLLGHSMGGLAAMGFALTYPERVRALISVDILPRAYTPDFRRELEALSVELSPYRTRKEIDAAMASIVPDLEVRQFLQMNVERAGRGFRWKLNLPALRKSEFLHGPDFSLFHSTFKGPALLVAGGQSSFVPEPELPLFNRYFPGGRIEVLEDCGHWLHYICSGEFQTLLQEFIGAL